MRKILFALTLLLFLPTLALAEVSTVDNGYKENISSYGVNATLDDQGNISVAETINYNFGSNEKHGIFRYVPTVYEGRRGDKRQSLTNVSITDGAGNTVPSERSFENNSEVLKIGEADKLVTGTQTYKISYTLSHMISSNSDGDRLLWGAIGTGWTVPMKNIVVTFINSEPQEANRMTTNCFFGLQVSSSNCDYKRDGNKTVIAKDFLNPGEGITLDSLYKTSTFPAPSKLEMFLWETHWYYWLPLIALIGFFLLWYEKGRDPEGRGTIVPMYDAPKGVTPYEASILIEDNISKRALPAAIISLAIQGYIKIHKKDVKVLFVNQTEYELIKLKSLPKTASATEQKVMSLFFTGRDQVNLNDLGDSFATLHSSLHSKAYQEVVAKGYYTVDPNISRFIYFGIAITLLVVGPILAFYLMFSALGFICMTLPGLIGLLFAFIMPTKTKAGIILKEDLLGLKMYIKVAEADRIRFHNAPAKSPEKFEELLPYAIIFGLEKQWAEEFKDIYKTPPTWYDGNLTTFSVIALTHDLGSFSNSAISSAVNASSSGGAGGFSGGGGGGGGGGSW